MHELIKRIGRPKIILDGPDRNGKTEIGLELSRILGAPYFKNSSEAKAFYDMDSEYFSNTLKYAGPFFIDYLKQSDAPVVIDRFHCSEWVYSRLFNRPTDQKALRYVDHLAALAGMKIVIPVRSSYVGRVDLESLGKIDDKKMETTDSLYRQFSEWTECECLILNVDDEDLTRETADILVFLAGKGDK
jgi:hypothetical protein